MWSQMETLFDVDKKMFQLYILANSVTSLHSHYFTNFQRM